VKNFDDDTSHMFLVPKSNKSVVLTAFPLSAAPPSNEFEFGVRLCKLVSEQSLQQELLADSEVDSLVHSFPRHVTTISMKAGRLYRLRASSPSFRPNLRIEDRDQRALNWLIDRPGAEAEIDFSPPEDGDYSIVVVATESDERGVFTLSLQEYAPEE
jgi:hypothetical protein